MLPSPCRAGGPRADSRQARVLMATHLSDEAAWGGWQAGGGRGESHAGTRFKRRRGSSSVHMRGQSWPAGPWLSWCCGIACRAPQNFPSAGLGWARNLHS